MSVTNFQIHRTFRIIRRHVHSCPVMCKSANKQAKTMAKLMTASYRKKKSWYSAEIMSNIPLLPANKKFQEGGTTKRRVDVLNKLFMRSITDLLATGEVAPYLIGHGVSITKVKVAADYSAVNVYWTAKGAGQNVDVDKHLEKAGFDLRHHLSQLHILGKVPRICFIKDKWQIIIEETLNCLENTEIKDDLENFVVNMKFEVPHGSEELAKIDQLEGLIDENPLPPMIHNVLGLDHAAIMTKIEKAVKKSEAKHRQSSLSSDSTTHLEHNVTDILGSKNDVHPSDVTKYIAKLRIEKKQAKQALHKQMMAKMEVFEKSKDEEYIDTEDGDFIEEFDVTKHYTELRE
ncbi:hypothetical protein R5R35_014546 [Gryllus longicercus]|uniref:Ribosome-binding factor A, mitochondrial n=1 Tax=Gryllus longicercus TaxID=2509291 RepID=A0AAN9VHN0_9ORTH